MEDLALKRAVKNEMLRYKLFFRKQRIAIYANRRFGRTDKTIDRLQLRKLLALLNARQNEVFDELKTMTRETAFDILGKDEKLMNRFVRRDRYDLTFSQKFQMSRKRIRKLITRRVRELYDKTKGEATSRELLAEAQATWEETSEFSKFIAYLTADAWNFAKFEEIKEDSETGRFEILLSGNHEKKDVCDQYAGIYDIDDDVDPPPYHPWCVCVVRAV